MRHLRVNTMVTALGLTTSFVSTPAMSTVAYYEWDGFFTFLNNTGAALQNTSIDQKYNNQFQTPITGTLAFDRDSGAGFATISASIAPFDFFNNAPDKPVELHSISIQSIGDGMGGEGTLLIGNMLSDWNGYNDMPVSIVWDAAGLIHGLDNGHFDDGVLDRSDVMNYGATPASDGTYVGANVIGAVNGPAGYSGYLGLGPVPIATTAWDTTANCTSGIDCESKSVSGILPLVYDNYFNGYDYIANFGGSIGGSPMIDGFASGFSPNFDITDIQYVGKDESLQFPQISEVIGVSLVPVPAAVWLFGSGLLGLLGVARLR